GPRYLARAREVDANRQPENSRITSQRRPIVTKTRRGSEEGAAGSYSHGRDNRNELGENNTGGSSERTARRNDRSPDRDQGRVRFSSADSKKLPFSTIDSGVLRNNFVNKIDPEKGVCFVRNNTSACIEVQIVNKV